MNNVKIYLDGADLNDVAELSSKEIISGFTSNPTLMAKSGINNYSEFIVKFLSLSNGKPVSFEVVSDDFDKMEQEAKKIYSYGNNIYVKIPITNSIGISSIDLIRKLLNEGLKINVTAILSENQINKLTKVLNKTDDVLISYFAGRVADTGIDPVPVMLNLKQTIKINNLLNTKILWASPRELYNIFQADKLGCDIITVADDIFNKISIIGKDLNEFSLETVKMFYNDALLSNFKIDLKK